MRVLGALIFSIGLGAFCAPASAADEGSAKLSAYQVCHPLAAIDMGEVGNEATTECNGIVKNADSLKSPDNLLIHCLENTSTRPDTHKYYGTCVLTDVDSDKIFMTYGGANSGEAKWIGGTGKYKDVSGTGGLGVVVAPGGGSNIFAYTLTFNMTWKQTAK